MPTEFRACPTCQAIHRRSHAYCLKCQAAYMREWRKTHPLDPEQKRKSIARSYANVYRGRGKLVALPCEDCATTHRVEMHHPDYSKPLEVVWLCRTCHLARHKEQLKSA